MKMYTIFWTLTSVGVISNFQFENKR